MIKKIAITAGSMQAGGAERVISILANLMARDGIEVKIYIWRSLDVFYPLDRDIEVVDLVKESKSSSLITNCTTFRSKIKKFSPDVLLSFSAPFNILALLSTIKLKCRIIVCERNDPRFVPFKPYQRLLRDILYWLADGIFTQTKRNAEYFNKYLRRKTVVIPNPIFMSSDQIGSALGRRKEKIIVSVARLKKQKNQRLLINAFKLFVSNHPDYRLVIYGEGEERDELIALIKNLGLEESVFLPGVSHNIFEDIKSAEMFVLPSNFEGMPNTLIESMCLGLPCISTKVSGATDLIDDGNNGILVDIDSVGRMYDAMTLLADNPDLRESIGRRAKVLYEKLNVDVIANQWFVSINNVHKL